MVKKEEIYGGYDLAFLLSGHATIGRKTGRELQTCRLVADFPDEKAAWVEVGKLGLQKYLDNPISCEPKFKDIAEHWRLWELRKEGIIGKKADETADRDEHNLDGHVLPRWGDCLAKRIKPTEVETWFEVPSNDPAEEEEQAAQVAHHRQNQFSDESDICARSATRVDFCRNGLQPIPFTSLAERAARPSRITKRKLSALNKWSPSCKNSMSPRRSWSGRLHSFTLRLLFDRKSALH